MFELAAGAKVVGQSLQAPVPVPIAAQSVPGSSAVDERPHQPGPGKGPEAGRGGGGVGI